MFYLCVCRHIGKGPGRKCHTMFYFMIFLTPHMSNGRRSCDYTCQIPRELGATRAGMGIPWDATPIKENILISIKMRI